MQLCTNIPFCIDIDLKSISCKYSTLWRTLYMQSPWVLLLLNWHFNSLQTLFMVAITMPLIPRWLKLLSFSHVFHMLWCVWNPCISNYRPTTPGIRSTITQSTLKKNYRKCLTCSCGALLPAATLGEFIVACTNNKMLHHKASLSCWQDQSKDVPHYLAKMSLSLTNINKNFFLVHATTVSLRQTVLLRLFTTCTE